MVTRRALPGSALALLGVPLLAPSGPASGAPDRPVLAGPIPAGTVPAEVRFRILREGSPIGTHRVAFAPADGGLTARIEVEIAVRLAGFTVFRLTHRFVETWSQGRLVLATSHYDRNGRVTEMTARAAGGAILVECTTGPQRLPAEAAPLTWWDAGRFGGPLFDNVNGRRLRVAVVSSALPAGGTRWTVTGDEEGEGTYAADGTWTGWRTRGEDGSTVVYERA